MHRARPFFGSLTEFMSCGPCITMVLERENAIARLRELMGATDPAKAAAGTIRKDFAASIEANAIHGSDAAETAALRDRLLLPGHRAAAVGRVKPASYGYGRARSARMSEHDGDPAVLGRSQA